MINLYINLDLRLSYSQSNYFRTPKSRNVNWDKARKRMTNSMTTMFVDEEW
jgi:hypothetical protein